MPMPDALPRPASVQRSTIPEGRGRTSISITTPFAGFQSPRYTPVPDDLFDELLSLLSGAELKVVLYIIRRTLGFKKDSEHISLHQICHGIQTRDGRVLDHGTGLSLSTAQTAIRGLTSKGIILATRHRSVERGDEATTYCLHMRDDSSASVPAPAPTSSEGTSSGKDHADSVVEGSAQESPTDGNASTSSSTANLPSSRLRPSAHLLSLCPSPLTENQQRGVPISGSGGYRKSVPQETDRKQTAIAVRNSKVDEVPENEANEANEANEDRAIEELRPSSMIHATGDRGEANALQAASTPASAPASSPTRPAQGNPHDPVPYALRTDRTSSAVRLPHSIGHLLKSRVRFLTTSHASTAASSPDMPLPRRKPTPQLLVAITELSQELGDVQHLASNTTQAMRLWEASGRSEARFVSTLYEARSITKQQPNVKRRMPYFWSVVRDLLGVSDALSALNDSHAFKTPTLLPYAKRSKYQPSESP